MKLISINNNSFYRNEPDDKKVLNKLIDIDFTYDKENIYLSGIIEIDEDFIIDEYTKFEKYKNTDYLRLQITISPKDRFGYVYYFYPNGSKFDAVRKTDLSIDDKWDSRYSYKTELGDNKWKIKATIPLSDLNYSNQDIHNWKIILSKAEMKHYNLYSAPYTNIDMETNYFNYGFDVVLKDISRSKMNLDFRGYSAVFYDNINNESKSGFEHSGIDVAYNPNSFSNTKITINPDFSEVPLDSATDIYNLEFSPVLRENRYFFNIDFDTFNLPQEIFYTRNIQQPEIAIKTTGNSNNLSYAMLYANDKSKYDNGNLYNSGDDYFIGSVIPKGDNWKLQMSTLNRYNKKRDYYNGVLRVNPSFIVNHNHEIEGIIDVSVSDDIFSKKEYGVNTGINYDSYGEINNYGLYINYVNENFKADMGMMNETGYTKNLAHYLHRFKSSLFRTINIDTWAEYSFYNDNLCEKFSQLATYFKLETVNGFILNNFIEMSRDSYNNDVYVLPRFTQEVGYRNYTDLNFKISNTFSKSLIYRLDKSFKNFCSNISLSYAYKDMYIFSLYLWTNHFYGLNNREKLLFDPNYQVFNIDAKLYLGENTCLSSGFRFNNYSGKYMINNEIYKFTMNKGLYCTIQYELTDMIMLSGGYSYSADVINNKSNELFNNFWLKILLKSSI